MKQKITLSESEWLSRIIPLPRHCTVRGSATVWRSQISLSGNPGNEPLGRTIKERLSRLAGCPGEGRFMIRISLTSEEDCPEHIRERIASVPNRDQAYCIEEMVSGHGACGLLLAANTALGLWYAALTLSDLCLTSGEENGDRLITIPYADITDWPDLEERGLWGERRFCLWDTDEPDQLAEYAEKKLNIIETPTYGAPGLARIYFEGSCPKVWIDENYLRKAEKLGLKVIPIIRHLEQLERTGLFDAYPEVRGVPAKEEKTLDQELNFVPAAYSGKGICFSQEKIIEVLAE